MIVRLIDKPNSDLTYLVIGVTMAKLNRIRLFSIVSIIEWPVNGESGRLTRNLRVARRAAPPHIQPSGLVGWRSLPVGGVYCLPVRDTWFNSCTPGVAALVAFGGSAA